MKFAKLKNESSFIFGLTKEAPFYRWADFQDLFKNDKVVSGVESLLDWIEHHEHLEAWLKSQAERLSSLKPVEFSLSQLDIPFRPLSFRDFYAFEEHVKNGRRSRGLEMIDDWYQFPVFYYSNHLNMKAPGDEIHFPKGAKALDFEMEIGCIVGKKSRNLSLEDASKAIFGFCLLNDFSARDVQKKEMALNMGPAKGKDFASSFGPIIYTKDEFQSCRKEKLFDLDLTMKLNGEEVCRSNASKIHYSFEEMLVRASADCDLFPGELLGSGTLGRGCLMEKNLDSEPRWLQSKDEVSLGWSWDSFPLNHQLA